MPITCKLPRETADAVADAFFDLYEVDLPRRIAAEVGDDESDGDSDDADDDGAEAEDDDEDEEDDEEDDEVYCRISKYAAAGYLRIDAGAIRWDPDGKLGVGGVVFREATGVDLSKVFEEKPRRRKGKSAVKRDAGLLRLVAGLVGRDVKHLRNLSPRHYKMSLLFARALL